MLNVDLKNFFPTINFGRVRGLFMAKPFCAPANVSTMLAQICCHNGALPQGAPTSPVVSNLICYRMDGQLLQLARRHGCFYTRYADDLTFSRRKGAFPPEIGGEDEQGDSVAGAELRELIRDNGFQIHPDKVHLFRNTRRQIVTGLTVNRRVNVSRKFIRQIRAVICDWRRNGLVAAEQRHHSEYYQRPNRLTGKPPLKRIIEGKLNFLRMIRGIDDEVRRNLQRQLVAVWGEYESVMEKENRELNMRDFFISHATEDKEEFVRPFVRALIREGVSVWYDEHELTIGSDLFAEINKGLAHSRYGIAVLSPNFFKLKKTWPDREIGALTAQEDAEGRKKIMPLWHKIEQKEVAAANPILARLIAWETSSYTLEELARKFRDELAKRRE